MRADWDLGAVRRVRRIVRTWRPDVLHAHDARSHAIALAALVSRSPAPHVVTRRVAFTPRGRIKYGTRVARFIAISNAVRDALVAGGVRPDRIDVVYSGVPTPAVGHPRDWRGECGWPAEAILAGVVGAMTAEKGVAVLGDIADGVAPALRARIRLLLLGGTAGGAGRTGAIESFRAGFVDEVHAAMAGLDVLWHPSSAEGLGTALIDAMALGVPPVAFAVGGVPELVEHEVSGLLVPPDDVAAFAAAVSRIVGDDALRARLAANGPRRAAAFGVDRMVDGAERTYRHVLSG
jgi:glycosyltransferase involved in cell wall biosynthesis